MKNHNISSIFADIQQDLYNADTYIQARDLILNKLENSHINSADKFHIRNNIEHIEKQYGTQGSAALHKLWSYITNSIFKYQGMGTNRNKKINK